MHDRCDCGFSGDAEAHGARIRPAVFRDSGITAELRTVIRDPEQAVSVSGQLRDLCLENGFSRRQAFLISLTAEELAINSITHGFTDGKDHYLELRAVVTEGGMILRLRDDGRPFNLVERYRMIHSDDPAKNIGLRIIFAGADEVSYHSSMNLNNVCIRINRDPA